MKIANFKPLDSQTSASSASSPAIDLSQVYRLSVQIVASSGSIDGSVKLQVSNDVIDTNYLNQKAPTNWSDLGSPVALVAPGVALIPSQDVCYRSLRVVYTSANPANTSLLTVSIMAQAV